MFGLTGGRVDTLIGTGAEFRGNISVEGSIVVDGKVDGNISASGRITLGAHAAVHGNLSAPDVIIGGKVQGHVISTGRVQLLPGAHVDGDIKAPKLAVTEGANFSGKVGMAGSVLAVADSFEGKVRTR
jgi:cytoskeletal protein CcmA (bactofilin family)